MIFFYLVESLSPTLLSAASFSCYLKEGHFIQVKAVSFQLYESAFNFDQTNPWVNRYRPHPTHVEQVGEVDEFYPFPFSLGKFNRVKKEYKPMKLFYDF